MRVSLSPLCECHLLSRSSHPRKCSGKDTSVPWVRTAAGTHSGAPGWIFSDCIHPKVQEWVHSSLLNPVYSRETRSCYKFSLVEKKCCARITVLFLKLLRKYFVLIWVLTGQQSDYTNLFYQEARQERWSVSKIIFLSDSDLLSHLTVPNSTLTNSILAIWNLSPSFWSQMRGTCLYISSYHRNLLQKSL